MASPTPSQPDSSCEASQFESFVSNSETENHITRCSLCQEIFTVPKILTCLHIFCQACLEKLSVDPKKIDCPICMQECDIPPDGIPGLPSDFAALNYLENVENLEEESPVACNGCRTKDAHAVAHCYDCDNYLCGNCVKAHQYMHCFEGHQLINLKEEVKRDFKIDKLLCCPQHLNETLLYFCLTCDMAVCKECLNVNHPKEAHEFDHISKIGPKQVQILTELHEQSKIKVNNLRSITQSLEHKKSSLQMQLCKSQTDVNATFSFYHSALEERKRELLKELDELYSSRVISVSLLRVKIQEMIDKMRQLTIFVERIMKFSSNTEILMFKQLLNAKLQSAIAYNPEINLQPMDFAFISNYQAIKVGVKNTFGYVRESDVPNNQIQPIARPKNNYSPDLPYQNGHAYEPNAPKQVLQVNLASPFAPLSPNLMDMGQYEKWSNGPGDAFQNGTLDMFNHMTDPIPNFSTRLRLYPLKSEVKRQKMIYHCKFGEFGVMDGQFTEPSGVAVNAQNDIIVADANSCRIQIFDKEGRYKFQFGESGKGDGKMLYPNRVAVVKPSGDIIVSERSPIHQIQIYNQYGQFVRRFAANVLEHPRGVTVDNKGRIIIVECKVMRIIIFDQFGNILQKFGCSKHLEFPNGVVTNDKQEIFVSDNRAHCVKVFSYEGFFLRNIGGEGITNYPIGVCINKRGEILIADNHNNFNITVFTQDGQLMNALESKVKHEQCFDVALMDDANIVLTSKDYRVYVYCYMPLPGTF